MLHHPILFTEIPTQSQATSESEVELDSLGRLFIELADAPSYQGDSESSQADEIEVTPASSSLEMFVPKNPRQVVRKVKLTHPDAHLAPDFLLKKAQFVGSSKRKTRSG